MKLNWKLDPSDQLFAQMIRQAPTVRHFFELIQAISGQRGQKDKTDIYNCISQIHTPPAARSKLKHILFWKVFIFISFNTIIIIIVTNPISITVFSTSSRCFVGSDRSSYSDGGLL